MVTPRSEFFSGIKAELPILIGVIPFGMIYGVLALGAGLEPVQAQAMSSIVFAGSAQFVSAQLLYAGTPGAVIVLTVAVVNLRHALYSASLAPYLKPLQPGWKWLLAYLLTDEAYAVTITHYQQGVGADEPGEGSGAQVNAAF
jgi:4-azaleucine resistance transporter AzlC